MVNLSSIESYDSKTIDGVNFKLRRATEPRRLELREQIVSLQRKIAGFAEEQEQIDAKPKPEQDRARWQDLEEQIIAVNDREINPILLKWSLVSVEDLAVDDVVITPDNLREAGPKCLYDEVLKTIKERAQLGGAQLKN